MVPGEDQGGEREAEASIASGRPKAASQSGMLAAATSAASEEKRKAAAVASQVGAGGEPGRPGERERQAEEGRDALAALETR